MSDLAAFLKARLDEDEAAAKAASPGPWHLNAEGDEVLAVDGEVAAEAFALSSNQQRATAAHIGRHDPARVLREVESKRAILAEHEPEPWGEPHPELLRCSQGHGDDYWTTWPCTEVCALAAVYSDHPDYRQEWRGGE